MLKRLAIIVIAGILLMALAVFSPCLAGLNLTQSTLHTTDTSFTFEGCLAPDGSMGVVYKNSGSKALFYKQAQGTTTTAEEEITSAYSGYYGSPFLVYDSQSAPHVFTNQSSDIVHFYKAGDTWEKEIVFTLDKTTYPDLSSQVTNVKIGGSDVFHILCSDSYSVFYITNKGGAWPQAPSIVDIIPDTHVSIFGWKLDIRGLPGMAVDSSNNAHVVYSTLYETRYLTNTSGNWVYEDIFSDQDIDYWPAENPDIALDSGGNPAIVGTEMGHAVTGSVTYAKLRYIARSAGGTWTAEVIASTADTYVGSDGNKYTGVNARLVFDGQDTPHILFSDHASWHNANGWNYTKDGQIRYAVKSGGQWNISTLYAQSTNNGEMLKLWLHVTPAGDGVHILGREVIRVGNVYDLYNDDETYNLLYLGTPYTAPAVPDAPVVSVSLSGTALGLSWNSVSGATGYTLFYAPYPGADPVNSADLGNVTSVDFDLFSGAAYFLALKAYNNGGSSGFSNIEYFTIP